jgi:PTS system galactitol-specific IIA component
MVSRVACLELQTTLNQMQLPVLVLWQLAASTKEDLFERVHQELYCRGQVHASYLSGVRQREEAYPTGLDFGDFAVALPHVDFEHVIRPALVIVLLREPLPFRAMDDPAQELACRLAIFPVLSAADEQLGFLEAVTTALQKPGFYSAFIARQSPQEIASDVEQIFCCARESATE